jgi:Na+:H+ antiporter
MQIHITLIQIAAILVAARIFAEVASHFRVPRVIGELFAGIILGPSMFAFITPSDPIKLLAEIGIILFLFNVGLGIDMEKLTKAGSRALVLAIIGFVLPFLLGFGLCFYTFGLSVLVSMFVGGTLTATSIGVTVRILEDLNRLSSSEGQIVLGAALIDDLLGILLLAILYEFSVTGKVSLENAGKIALFVGGFFLIAPVVAKIISPAIEHLHKTSPEPGVIPVAIVSLVLSFAALAHIIGAPELLGGFAAGIALSRRFFLPLGLTLKVDPEFSKQIRHQMAPIIQLFTPIFFVMVGLSLDLSAVDWSSIFIWIFSLSLAAVAITSKLIAGLFVPENHYRRVAIGMSMVPRGEIGLIFAELGRVSGIFDNEIYAAIVIVIAYTTLFSPFWIKSYYRVYGHRFTNLMND